MINRSGTLLDSTTVDSSFNSDILVIEQDNINVRVVVDEVSSVAGTIQLQASQKFSTDDADWEDITSGSLAVSGDSSKMFDIGSAYFHYLRVKYTHSSGSGIFKITYCDKKWH